MHDESIDDALKELEAALEVRPSPEMVARIRCEVGREIPGVPRFTVPWVAGLAAVGIIVVTSGLWLARRPATTEAPPNTASAIPPPPVEGFVVRPSGTPPLSRRGDRARTLHRAEDAASTDQSIALTRLLAAIRTGRVSVPPEMLVRFQAAEPLPEIRPIEIPLIRVDPLIAPPDDGGQRRPL